MKRNLAKSIKAVSYLPGGLSLTPQGNCCVGDCKNTLANINTSLSLLI